MTKLHYRGWRSKVTRTLYGTRKCGGTETCTTWDTDLVGPPGGLWGGGSESRFRRLGEGSQSVGPRNMTVASRGTRGSCPGSGTVRKVLGATLVISLKIGPPVQVVVFQAKGNMCGPPCRPRHSLTRVNKLNNGVTPMKHHFVFFCFAFTFYL